MTNILTFLAVALTGLLMFVGFKQTRARAQAIRKQTFEEGFAEHLRYLREMRG